MSQVFDVSGLTDEEVDILLAGREWSRHGNLATVGDGWKR